MLELKPSELVKVKPLFEGMEIHLGLYALLQSCISGEVYVDHLESPNAALACIHQKRYYLAGSPENSVFKESLRGYFAEVAYPRLRHERAFLVSYQPDGWQATIGDIFQDSELMQAGRHYYLYTDMQDDWPDRLPAGFDLRKVDRALLNDGDLKNTDILVEEMCSERASVEDFLQNSFGVCVLHKGGIAGMCLSEYNCLNRCEVGIITLEAYQRKGLGTAMTRALIKQARERGITQIGWHCYARNQPSIATALRAGFVKRADYPACIVRIPQG
jgi:GNAT superfamily N-acetyltransferase